MPLPTRPGCLGWLLITGGLVFVALLGGWLWFRSDADLRAVDRAYGVPVVAVASAMDTLPPDPALALRRFADHGQPVEERAVGQAGVPEPGAPLVAGVAVDQAELAPAWWDDLHHALADIRAGQVAHRADPLPPTFEDLRDDWEFIVHQRLVERIMCTRPEGPAGSGPDLPTLVADAATWAMRIEPRTAETHFTALAQTIRLARALAWRLAEDGRATGPGAAWRSTAELAAVAAGVRALRAELWRTRASSAVGTYHVLRRLHAEHVIPRLRLVVDPLTAALDAVRLPLLQRWNRATVLRGVGAYWRATADAATPGDLRLGVVAITDLSPPWAMTSDGAKAIFWTVPSVHHTLRAALLELDVLLAELDARMTGTAVVPPEDSFDPLHRPLRPLLDTAQRRIGWYSVSIDGADDGGADGADYRIPTVP